MYEFRSNEGGVACEETPEMRLKIEAGMCLCECFMFIWVSLCLRFNIALHVSVSHFVAVGLWSVTFFPSLSDSLSV